MILDDFNLQLQPHVIWDKYDHPIQGLRLLKTLCANDVLSIGDVGDVHAAISVQVLPTRNPDQKIAPTKTETARRRKNVSQKEVHLSG